MNKELRWVVSLAAGVCSLALLSEGSGALLMEAVAAVGETNFGELVANAGALTIVP